ncbi:MAG: CBS domain-containing protein [Chthoniobacter sp.]|nr:CBS domain-containing protein [Chthoniobacter sp.]
MRDTDLEHVVTEKQPVLNPQDSVQEAGDKMRQMDVDTLPVVDGRHLVGVVDQRHPDRCAAGFGHDPSAMTVSAIMNNVVIHCFEDDNCAEALRKMDEQEVDRLPVVDREMRIVGVVRRADLTERRPAVAGQ